MNSWFVIVSLLPFLISYISGMCDQRPFGGKLMCCLGKDSKCFTKVDTKRKHGQSNDVCYCDSHCKFTKDCCPDYEKVKRLCNKPVNCTVSDWRPWSNCDAECGYGTMTRKRKIIQYPKRGGRPCPILQQTRGCNANAICQKKRKDRAFILPISYRRPTFGKWLYENILPAKKSDVIDKHEHLGAPIMDTYCIHYKIMYRKSTCNNTWANKMKIGTAVCMECQSRVMTSGRCRGEGSIGVKSRWKAIGLERCYGDWIRLGEMIPNCSCKTKEFSDFVFV